MLTRAKLTTDPGVHGIQERLLPQRRKGAKENRQRRLDLSRLCAFAPLREQSSYSADIGARRNAKYDRTARLLNGSR